MSKPVIIWQHEEGQDPVEVDRFDEETHGDFHELEAHREARRLSKLDGRTYSVNTVDFESDKVLSLTALTAYRDGVEVEVPEDYPRLRSRIRPPWRTPWRPFSLGGTSSDERKAGLVHGMVRGVRWAGRHGPT